MINFDASGLIVPIAVAFIGASVGVYGSDKLSDRKIDTIKREHAKELGEVNASLIVAEANAAKARGALSHLVLRVTELTEAQERRQNAIEEQATVSEDVLETHRRELAKQREAAIAQRLAFDVELQRAQEQCLLFIPDSVLVDSFNGVRVDEPFQGPDAAAGDNGISIDPDARPG